MLDYVARQLSYHLDGEEIVVGQDELLSMEQNIVILGEAGMGKTMLLKHLEREGAKFILARRLVRASDPRSLIGNTARVLIDAVDEVSSYKDGDAVDELVGKLEDAGGPSFILSCRAEDWREATAKSMIEAVYATLPIEMTLRPFDRDQIIAFLSDRLGADKATEVFDHYQDRAFADWLGNPQTLSMLANVIAKGGLPRGTAELFSHYVDVAWDEANDVRRESGSEVAKETVLDTLGAAFAAVILGGKEGLAWKGTKGSETLLSMAELAELPGCADWDAIKGNRLLARTGQGNGAFTYIHRRVGEWLAARWLARQTTNAKLRDRLLDNLIVQGIVPASLRGLFAWLALYDGFASRVIFADPMAVIEYGDADALSENAGAALLDALSSLAERSPWFAGSGRFRARSLISETLRARTFAKILDERCPSRLRVLLAQQFQGEALEPFEVEALRKLILHEASFYSLREDAAAALIGSLDEAEWPEFVNEVLAVGRMVDARLAAFMVLEAGLELFDDEQAAEVVMAAGGFGSAGTLEDDKHIGTLWRYRYEVPDERLTGFLDALAVRAQARLPEYRSIESSEIINLGDSLIARRLDVEPVEPSRLLKWLHAFGGKDSYVDDDEKRIATFVEEHDELRRAMQREWLSGAKSPEKLRAAAFDIQRVHSSLTLSDADFADFLSSLPSDYEGWKDIAWLVRHTPTEGQRTREALRRFSKDEADFEAWVEQALNPPKPDWQVRQERREAKYRTEREKRWGEFRNGLAKERDELSQGRFGVLLQAANVYLGRYSDLHHLKTSEERLAALLGPDLTKAFRKGLEACLRRLPPWPHAELIARDYAHSRAWNARYVLFAALAERFERLGSLDPIDDDQLIAAQLHISNHTGSGDEWAAFRDTIWTRIVSDSQLFERYARLSCEGSLNRGSEIVSGLYEITREAAKGQSDLVTRLAEEWLRTRWRMHWRAEAELLDVVLGQGDHGPLRSLVPKRLAMKTLTDERRRNWEAVGLIVDFERRARSAAVVLAKDPELFWAIRERIGARRPYDDLPRDVPTELAGWLVEHARKLYPLEGRPGGVTTGDTNPWDASEAIGRMIGAIGSDTSDRAGQILRELAKTPDGYRDRVLAVLAEYHEARAEMAWTPLEVTSLARILTDAAPETMPDLRSEVLRLLGQVQALIRSNDTDSWRHFYESDRVTPKEEEDCSDALIDILRQCSSEIGFSPEKHLGDNREGDIACEIGGLHLPIEVKGQWHPQLWRAADNQLEAQQAIDHKAEGYGVFLALWFGEKSGTKRLTGPPKGAGIRRPESPSELEDGLIKASKAAASDRIRIKVLDLSRG
jgi:hypothetical protein